MQEVGEAAVLPRPCMLAQHCKTGRHPPTLHPGRTGVPPAPSSGYDSFGRLSMKDLIQAKPAGAGGGGGSSGVKRGFRAVVTGLPPNFTWRCVGAREGGGVGARGGLSGRGSTGPPRAFACRRFAARAERLLAARGFAGSCGP